MKPNRRHIACGAVFLTIGVVALLLSESRSVQHHTARRSAASAEAKRTRLQPAATSPPPAPQVATPPWTTSKLAPVAALLQSNAWTNARCVFPTDAPPPQRISFPGSGLSSPVLQSGNDALFFVPPGEFDGIAHFNGPNANGESVIFSDGQDWVCDAPTHRTAISLESDLDCTDDCPVHIRIREQILPVDLCTSDWHESTLFEPNEGWVDDDVRPPTLIAWTGEGWRDLSTPLNCSLDATRIDCTVGNTSVASCEHLEPIESYDTECSDDACRETVLRAFSQLERLGHELGINGPLVQAMTEETSTADAINQAFPDLFFAGVNVPHGDAATTILDDAGIPQEALGRALVNYAASLDPATKP